MSNLLFNLKIGTKFIISEIKSKDILLLFLSLFLSAIILSSILIFSNKIDKIINKEVSVFLGGDLVVKSNEPLSSKITDKAKGLKSSQTITTYTVVHNNENFNLSRIKAVSDNYPLLGELTFYDELSFNEIVAKAAPKEDEVWVDRRLLSILEVNIGDSLTIGEHSFTITKILGKEPDEAFDLITIAPKVLVNIKSIAKTNILNIGSRAVYKFNVTGTSDLITNYKDYLSTNLLDTQELQTATNSEREIATAQDKVISYINLSVILNILLAAIAVLISSVNYVNKNYKTIAILKTLGFSLSQVFYLFAISLLGICLVSSVLGFLLGVLLDGFAQVYLFQELKHVTFSFAEVFIKVLITQLLLMVGFALPSFLNLLKTNSFDLLKKETVKVRFDSFGIYVLMLIVLYLLINLYISDYYLSLTIIASLVIMIISFYIVLAIILNNLGKIKKHLSLKNSFGISNLYRNFNNTISQVIIFSIIIFIFLLLTILRFDMLKSWQQAIPKDTPNHFAVNIVEDEQNNFNNTLLSQGIKPNQQYPVVRGNLVAINNEKLKQNLFDESSDRAGIYRPLNLTQTNIMPKDNVILAGNWLDKIDNPRAISVEEKFANRLGIRLNDRLDFAIAEGKTFGIVSSIRQVNWDSMTPNFYVIFKEGALQDFPKTYMTSFYLAEKLKLNNIFKNHSTVTIIEIDKVIEEINSFINKAINALNILVGFAFLAAILIMFALLNATLSQRLYQATIVKILGANRKLMLISNVVEFFVISLFSSTIAVIIANSVAYYLARNYFGLNYSFAYKLNLIVVLISMALIVGASFVYLYRTTKVSITSALQR